MKKLLALLCCFSPVSLYAQESTAQVGKHVTGNMDAMSMILSLLMVLALIVVSALVLKRFQPGVSNLKGLKIVTSLHLSAKERLVVIQVGDKQLLLGVTAHQISVLDTLDEPLEANSPLSPQFGQSFLSLMKK